MTTISQNIFIPLIVNFLAQRLAGFKVNHIWCQKKGQMIVYRKKRRWYSRPLIVLGNKVFRWMGADVQFLLGKDWIHREKQVYHYLYQEKVYFDRQGHLHIKKREGEVLSKYLNSTKYSLDKKEYVLEIATKALYLLHQQSIPNRRGHIQSLTHGDATTANVVVDIKEGKAQWFDFETQHPPHRSEDWRRADDLFVFLGSVAKYIELDNFDQMMGCILSTYGDRKIVNKVYNLILKLNHYHLIFHLARMKMSYKMYEKFKENLLRVVTEYLKK